MNSDQSQISLPEAVRARIGVRRIRQHTVTEEEIRRFAQAIGDTLVTNQWPLEASLLFCQALAYEAVPLDQLPPDGLPRELDVPIEAARTVGGSSDYQINRRVQAGETVTIDSGLKNVYAKPGKTGLLYFVEVETRFTAHDGELIACELATFIKRV